MLDEVAIKVNLGCKISPGHLVAGCFGDDRINAIVGATQTLDKLVVHVCSSSSLDLPPGDEATTRDWDNKTFPVHRSQNQFVVIKDVIKSVSVQNFKRWPSEDGTSLQMSKDGFQLFGDASESRRSFQRNGLLLIGCAGSIIVFDVAKQSTLLDLSIDTPIEAIASQVRENSESSLTICGGYKRISAIKIEPSVVAGCSADVFCERTLDYTVSCISQGQLADIDLLICGSPEQGISIHQLDLFDLNIQACKLSINETASVNCLCPIYSIELDNEKQAGEVEEELMSEKLLPSLLNTTESFTKPEREQMNYFAYGLENGIVGVYCLFFTRHGTRNSGSGHEPESSSPVLRSESLWKQKCKQPPVSMLMFDINGDGYDELMIGFRNGRLDARSPFTGQLLATTRCFKSDRLAGLTVVDYYSNGRLMLIACSTGGYINGYMSKSSKPRLPLRGYNLADGSQRTNDLSEMLENTSVPVVASRGPFGVPETIDEEHDPNSHTELHIESGGDNMRPRQSDTRQNNDYLLRINSLLSERLELEKGAREVYRQRFFQSSRLSLSEVTVQHRWDFDYVTARLRLTTVVSTSSQELQVSFIRLEDEKRNFLENGFLLINMETNYDEDNWRNRARTRTQVVVIPVRSKADLETEFLVSVFFKTLKSPQMIQVFTKLIETPEYSMITFNPDQNRHAPPWKPVIKLRCKLDDREEANQVLDWLREKLLCFQFGRLISNNPRDTAVDESIANWPACDDHGGFEFNLLDARHASMIRVNNNHDPEDSIMQESSAEPAKFNYAGSSLRIASSASESDEVGGQLILESESSSDSSVSLLRSLVIDRLRSNSPGNGQRPVELAVDMQPVLDEIGDLDEQASQLEESEKRLQTELYELSDYAGSLMEQLCIANQLNEFGTSRELLTELSMMLNEAQNAARSQSLTCGTRRRLVKKRDRLRDKVASLNGA